MEFVVGMLVGALLFWLFWERKKPSGRFVVDFTDPMKDVCRFELDENLEIICQKKHVIFDVKTYGFTQE